MRHPLLFAVLTVALCAPVMGASEDLEQDRFDLLRSAEILAHRSLMRRIAGQGDILSEFETDGCSGGMSAGWSLVSNDIPELAKRPEGDLPWAQCCVDHDETYHVAGGASEAEVSYDARLAADEELRRCVIATGEARRAITMERFGLSEGQVDLAYRILARSMFNAVRLGGGPCTRLPWRWGYGYPNC